MRLWWRQQRYIRVKLYEILRAESLCMFQPSQKCLGVLWGFHSTCPRLGGPRKIWDDRMQTKIMRNCIVAYYWYELLLHPWTPHIVAQQAVIGDCYKNISCNIFSPRLRPPWTQLPNLQRKTDGTLWGGPRGQVHHWILLVSWRPENFRICAIKREGNTTWNIHIFHSCGWIRRTAPHSTCIKSHNCCTFITQSFHKSLHKKCS